MDFDVEALKAFIAKRTQETWDERHSPYFISFVAIDLKKAGHDYRPLIAPLKLRQWVATTEIPGVRVLVHPVHKAKVGFVPDAVEYEFEEAEPDASQSESEVVAVQTRAEGGRSRRALMYFLQALSRLPEEDLESVHIPMKVIVKLMKD